MNRHVVDVLGGHERASATPDGSPSPTRARPPAPKSASPEVLAEASAASASLRGQQLWFTRAVTTPESDAASVGEREAEQLLTAGPRLSALERLDIYRRGYHTRLIECLADDYSALEHALGEETFDDLCRAYIERHPSSSPNLNAFGRFMAAFCRTGAPEPFPLRAWAADLAELEWAIVEVIHAPSSEPLTLEGLRDVPPEAWATARLLPNTAFRLLRFEHPVNRYFQAYREDRSPPIPAAEASSTVVYRSGPTVWRMDLTDAMFEVLSSLVSGATLEDSLARAEAGLAHLDEQEAVQRVMGWFREWVSSGLFVQIAL